MPKVAAIQMCSSTQLKENLTEASRLIAQAVEKGAELVVLPEMFPLIGPKPADIIKYKEKYGAGEIQNFLATTAKKHKIWLVSGTIPIVCDNENKVKAACLVFDDQGNSVARYDKIHLFDVIISTTESYEESDTIEPGNEITVLKTPFGQLGLAVCYDIRFSGLFTELFNRGAEIITIPAAFTMKTGKAHWQVLARARAIENFCYVIGACQGGKHDNGRETYGHSLIVDPWGKVLQELDGTSKDIILADIDLNYLQKIRQAIPIEKHQIIKPDISNLQ